MKQLKIWMSFMCLFALLFTSCSKENETLQNSPEKATLSFEALLNDLTRKSDSKANIPECSDAVPVYVEIIIANGAGEDVVGSTATPFRVDLTTGQAFTEEVPELRLEPGEYSLEHFVVYDQDDNMIWIAPRDGEMATFVDNVLPMSINLGAGVKKYVEVDVLCFDDRNVNEYGYLFFDFNENEAIEFCIFGNVCDETGRHSVAEYEVDVWYGTSNSGTVLYSNLGNTITTNENNDETSAPVCVALPDTEGEDSYYFEISMDGEIIRSGAITDADVRGLFDGDSNTEYFHFREGNCNLNDSPDLFDEGGKSEFTVTITNVVTPKPIFQSGVFKIPEGASDSAPPAPLFPGDSYEFDIHAGPVVLPMDGGTRLSFVTMFVQSNDLFFAPNEGGIPLYDGSDNPIGASGPVDVTNQVNIYDAGTEVNEATGGPNQKPQQAPTAEDQGIDENGVVTRITNNTDSFGNIIPDADEVIKVTIENIGDAQFRVRIMNVSTATTIATPAKGEGTSAAVPISPGVYAVHTRPAPFFIVGEPAAANAGLVSSEEGVENIAEDGFPAALAADTFAATGLIVPLSPGAWAVHENGATPIYELNESDFAEGLEGVAEDGTPGALANSLSTKESVRKSDFFNTPVGASATGPLGPGQSYKFTFTASEGESLSLATMFIQSNDWFYSFDESGIQLFQNGAAISGNVTSQISLYDSGTEIDEFPGAGLFQVIRQPAPNTGPNDDSNVVTLVNPANHENVQPASQVIRVTIESNN